jgi:hypothetical protein
MWHSYHDTIPKFPVCVCRFLIRVEAVVEIFGTRQEGVLHHRFLNLHGSV